MAAAFDEKGALERCDNDRDLLSEIISIFFHEYDTQLAELKRQTSAGDAHNVSRSAHAMKSALGNIGAVQGFELARDIEMLGKANAQTTTPSFIAECTSKISALETAVTDFRAAAKGYLTP